MFSCEACSLLGFTGFKSNDKSLYLKKKTLLNGAGSNWFFF